jgi:hypothetical protein
MAGRCSNAVRIRPATLLSARDNCVWAVCIYRTREFPPGGTTLALIIIIILLLLVFGSFPAYPYSRSWGYYPAGGLGTILLIVIILWLLHVI